MTHSLSIRIAEMCLRSRSTQPLREGGTWVVLAKKMSGAIEQAIRQRIAHMTCVRIWEQH